MKRCLIFHVFNTLTEHNIMMSLDSLLRQSSYPAWDTFLVWNSSTQFSSSKLVARIKSMGFERHFARIESTEPSQERPQSSSSDFMTQFKEVDGHDLYLVAKADFYLGRDALSVITTRMADPSVPALCVFKKYDLREYITPSEIIALGEVGSYICCRAKGAKEFNEIDYQSDESLKVGIIGYQGLDGIMHAYTDAAREKASCGEAEMNRSWGACSIYRTMIEGGCELVQDDRIYALHIFHEVPQKTDINKLKDGYRY